MKNRTIILILILVALLNTLAASLIFALNRASVLARDIQHLYIYRQVKNEVAESNYVPESLNNFNGHIPSRMQYDPNAWGKADRVLLVSPLQGEMFVTFGNGTQAMVSYWGSAEKGKEKLRCGDGRKYTPLQAAGLALPLPITALLLLLFKKRKEKTP